MWVGLLPVLCLANFFGLLYILHIAETEPFELGAAVEGVIFEGLHAGTDQDILKIGAAVKCRLANLLYRNGEVYARYGSVARKSVCADSGDAVRNINLSFRAGVACQYAVGVDIKAVCRAYLHAS